MKRKSCWLFLDGKKHCDLLEWALAANKTLAEAKKYMLEYYSSYEVEFKVL